MKIIVLKILVLLLRTIYVPFKMLKVKNKITYIRRQSNKESLDFRKIREELEAKYPEYQNVVLTKKIEQGIINKIGYCIETLKQMYHIATSKVVVLDTYCITACTLKHKRETKIVQIWHALGAIKKFGYQTIGKEQGANIKIAKIMCMHENYNYVLAPSRITAKFYEKAFNINEEKIIFIGLPRIDYILEENEEIKEEIYNEYPILRTKRNIVYVPTFRRGEKIELDEFIKKFDTEKYNLIIKLHPLDLKNYNFKNYNYEAKKGIIFEQKFKTYDLLKIASGIITDYSSLAIEASIRDIPVYFYTYDIEKYQRENGININFSEEAIGYYQTSKIEKLLELLDENYKHNALKEFKNKYVEVDTENVTKQLGEFIVRLARNEKIEDISNKYIKEEQII